MSLRKWSTWLLSLLLVGTSADAQNPPADRPVGNQTAVAADEAPFLGGFLKETRIVYPLQLGRWKAVGEHLYEQQELGVSVRYAHGDDVDRWIDLYFYPAGVLSAAQFEQAALSEREQIQQIRQQPGGHGAIDMGALQRFSYAVPGEGRKQQHRQGYVVDMSYVHEGENRNSVMTLLLDRLYFIKGRFSVAEHRMSRRRARKLLVDFIGELSPRLEIVSSGQCWMPLPVGKLEAAAAEPEARLASGSGDGPHTEWLLADRVLARDPESPGAKALMVLGMAVQGRLFPGCGSAEPINPVVPEGMREIRLEFRGPLESGPDPTRRIRGTRPDLG